MCRVVTCFVVAIFVSLSAFADGGVDLVAQRIRIALKTEPPTLNSLQATDNISGLLLNHLQEGLLQYDAHNQLTAGVAERWELRADGATFWLRKNSYWSDGRPVTARDFLFAWRQVVLPTTASRYAFLMFPVKNAERINKGEVPIDQLGVSATGDYRIDVQFEHPCPYFLGLTANSTYFPLREDFYRARGERYAADAGDLLFNGPFTLTRWDHGAHLTLKKNPRYWNRDQIHLQEIDIPYITGDLSTVFNLFQEGSIALSQLDAPTLQQAVDRKVPLQLFPTVLFFFLELNLRDDRMTRNIHLRRAMQAIFSPEQLVNKIIALPGNRPAPSLFPATVKGLHTTFREEFPPRLPARGLAIARREMELAKTELKLQQWPPLVLLARDSPLERKIAEYLQQLLQTGLGIPTRIDIQVFKQALEKMNTGDFDVVITGWGADFDDPITFGDLFASWNINNRGRYNSAQYDALVRAAYASADQSERMKLFAQMQQHVIDDVLILPMFESTEIYAMNPQLRGVTRALYSGDIDFRFAYLEGSQK